MKNLLSPRELGEAIGVSESSLKRWADEGRIRAVRTAGGHRRIPLSEAVRFIRDTGQILLNPDLLGLNDLSRGILDSDAAAQQVDEPLFLALKEGNAEITRGLLTFQFLQGRSLAELCDGPISNAMNRMGELWKHESAGIFYEHRATDLCIQALNFLRSLMPPPALDAPAAVGGGPINDPYLLPSLMAASVLSQQGWREYNLGPETPAEVLVSAARHCGARLVWWAVSVPFPADHLLKQIQTLAKGVGGSGARLVVGGRSLPAGLKPLPANVQVAASMSELAAFSKGLAASIPAFTTELRKDSMTDMN